MFGLSGGFMDSVGGLFGGGTIGTQSAMMGLASGAGPAIASFYGGERANEANKDLARENMRWSENLSNTSYQRAMKDLEAAGLNPLLVGRLGGASTPGVNMPMMHDTITPAINTATQVAQTRSNVGLQSTQGNLNQSHEMLMESQWQLNKVREQIERNAIPASEAKSIIADNVANVVKAVDNVVGVSGGRAEAYRNAASNQVSEWMSLAKDKQAEVIDAVQNKLSDVKRETKQYFNNLLNEFKKRTSYDYWRTK